MSTYETPGVYIKEISTLAPSSTAVATAIPAFIGLTEKAISSKGETLNDIIPTRISSLDEYKTFFGEGSIEPLTIEITNTIENAAQITVKSPISVTDFIFYDDNGTKKTVPIDATFSLDTDNNIQATLPNVTTAVSLIDKNGKQWTRSKPGDLFIIDDTVSPVSVTLSVIQPPQDRIFYEDVTNSNALTPVPVDATFSLSTNGSVQATLSDGTTVGVTDGTDPISEINNNFDIEIDTENNREIFSYFNLYDLMSSTNEVELAEYDHDANVKIQGPKSKNFMYASIQLYFANGGGPCYVVSVGDYTTPTTELKIKLKEGLEKLEEEDEPTLILFPDIYALDGDLDIYEEALAQCNKLKDRFVIMDVATTDNTRTDATVFRDNIASEYLKYGAAYYPDLITSLPYTYDLTSFNNTIIQTFKTESGTIIDTSSNGIRNDDNFFGLTAISGIRPKNQSIYNDIINKISSYTMTVPSSGAIAGVYVRVDEDRGVWKAPANVSLNRVTIPKITVTDSLQKDLNIDTISGKSINAIRSFTGRGTLVWGARTLDGNDNEWRYVQVRRFFNYVEESIQKSISWSVFEGNTTATWTRLKIQIETFLTGVWKAGGLAGGSTAEAFFVNIGLGSTMNNQDILEGRMNVEIGLAAIRPAEFIILKFSHFTQQS